MFSSFSSNFLTISGNSEQLFFIVDQQIFLYPILCFCGYPQNFTIFHLVRHTWMYTQNFRLLQPFPVVFLWRKNKNKKTKQFTSFKSYISFSSKLSWAGIRLTNSPCEFKQMLFGWKTYSLLNSLLPWNQLNSILFDDVWKRPK